MAIIEIPQELKALDKFIEITQFEHGYSYEIAMLFEYLSLLNNSLMQFKFDEPQFIEGKFDEIMQENEMAGEILEYQPDLAAEIEFNTRYDLIYPQYLYSGFIFAFYSLIERMMLDFAEIVDLKDNQSIYKSNDKKKLVNNRIKQVTDLLNSEEYKNSSKKYLDDFDFIRKLRNSLIHEGFRIPYKIIQYKNKQGAISSHYVSDVPKNYLKYLKRNELFNEIYDEIIPHKKYCYFLITLINDFFDYLKGLIYKITESQY